MKDNYHNWVKRLGQHHVSKTGEHQTMCGMPMLGNNHLQIPSAERVICPTCTRAYLRETTSGNTTTEQATKLIVKWEQINPDNREDNFFDWLDNVQPEPGSTGALMVPWCGMLLGIERDGHCHS